MQQVEHLRGGPPDNALYEQLGEDRRDNCLIPRVLGIVGMRMSKDAIGVLEKGEPNRREEIQYQPVELGNRARSQFAVDFPADHLDCDRVFNGDEIGTGAVERVKENSRFPDTAPAIVREKLSRVIAEILQPAKIKRDVALDQSPGRGFMFAQPFQALRI